jgi:polysaccharide export outer membrane protein
MKHVTVKILFTIPALLTMTSLIPQLSFGQGNAAVASGAPSNALPGADGGSGTAIRPESRIRIGPGDLLDMTVFDSPELAQTVRVSDAGDASFNLIGEVHLAGLTANEAQSFIAGKLKAGNYVLNPQVAVLIKEYNTQGVSVVGEVNKPGVYNVLGTQTLLDLIAAAGGTTAFAGPEATIRRSTDNSIVSVRFSKDAQTSFSSDVRVYPGDKIIVGRAGLVYVLGDVGRPGGFVMENDGKLTLVEALAMAGGSNPTASLSRAKLIRKTTTSYTEVPIQLKKMLHGEATAPQLQTEDILYIPSNALKSTFRSQASSIIGATTGAAIYHSMP